MSYTAMPVSARRHIQENTKRVLFCSLSKAANEKKKKKTENQAMFGFVGSGVKDEIVHAPCYAVASKGQSKEGRTLAIHNISCCNLWYCNMHSPQKANFKIDWLISQLIICRHPVEISFLFLLFRNNLNQSPTEIMVRKIHAFPSSCKQGNS